jgi:hypothetical protein
VGRMAGEEGAAGLRRKLRKMRATATGAGCWGGSGTWPGRSLRFVSPLWPPAVLCTRPVFFGESTKTLFHCCWSLGCMVLQRMRFATQRAGLRGTRCSLHPLPQLTARAQLCLHAASSIHEL